MAESGGCQYALAGPNDIRPVKTCTWTRTDGENSCGFWQINLRAHPHYHAPEIFDPYGNALAAKAISNNGSDWNPWSKYKNGAYRHYLQESGGAAAQAPPAAGARGGGPPARSPFTAPAATAPVSLTGWAQLDRSLRVTLTVALAISRNHRAAALRKMLGKA